MAACQNGHLDIVEFLLTLPQVNVNAITQVSYSSLSLFRSLAVMYSQKGTSVLLYASINGHADILEALLKHPKVDVNKDNVCLTFVVHFMCEHNNYYICRTRATLHYCLHASEVMRSVLNFY